MLDLFILSFIYYYHFILYVKDERLENKWKKVYELVGKGISDEIGNERPYWNVPGYDYLKSRIDLHVHPESGNDVEYVKQACMAGMRAVLFKSFYTTTFVEARLCQIIVDDFAKQKNIDSIKIYGGVVLNNSTVGGLNPKAVKTSLSVYPKFTKMIWMPTTDSGGHIDRTYGKKNYDKNALYVAKNGRIVPEVEEILNIIAENKIAVSCGHISIEEMFVVIDSAKSLGVKKIIVDHPCFGSVNASIEEQKQFVKKGAYLNYCASTLDPLISGVDPEYVANCIKTVGPKNCTMSTDVGAVFLLQPLEAFRIFIWYMKICGVNDKEIDIMTKINPAKILGI